MSVIVSFAPGPEGEAAFEQAARQSERLGRPVVVVCTVPSEAARGRAQELVAELPDALTRFVEDGQDAVEVIIEAVEETSAELLVIGLRRRTPVGKLILGSSAQRLLLDAPCPVLAVKPD